MKLVFSAKFWAQFISEPKTAIELLKRERSLILCRILEFVLYWRIVISEYWQNHCITRASALAFTLLLTLIPLLASLSFMLANFIEVHPEEVESIVKVFLPFAPPTILVHIGNFFANAQKLRGVGIFVLIVFAVGLLGTVEESFNAIWKVVRQRSIFNRLITFTMVMVYGPLMFFVSFHLRNSGIFGFLPGSSFILNFLPILFVVLAFTIFIWLIPNTKVNFKSAFLGGVVAGGLFELERWGFGTYVRLSIQTKTIYGAYGILPFFLISLFFVGMFILFGAQIAYVFQNFRVLMSTRSRNDRRVSSHKTYLGIRVLMDVMTAFNASRAPVDLSVFCKRYELSEAQALSLVRTLVSLGYIHAINGKEAYVPAFDISTLKLKEFINNIEGQSRRIPLVPNDSIKHKLAKFFEDLKRGTDISEDERAFSDMTELGEARARSKTAKLS